MSATPQRKLAEGANFEILGGGGWVWCVVRNPPEMTPDEGAQGAATMDSTLRGAADGSGEYSGLVFDVRAAPPVFGPKTRDALARLFASLTRHGWRIAVIVNGGAIQSLQFRSLCTETTAGKGAVFTQLDRAKRWVTTDG